MWEYITSRWPRFKWSYHPDHGYQGELVHAWAMCSVFILIEDVRELRYETEEGLDALQKAVDDIYCQSKEMVIPYSLGLSSSSKRFF